MGGQKLGPQRPLCLCTAIIACTAIIGSLLKNYLTLGQRATLSACHKYSGNDHRRSQHGRCDLAWQHDAWRGLQDHGAIGAK